MKREEEELLAWIERARQGDREAQEALVRAVQNRVYYHCKKVLKKEEDARDAAQDVFITMLTSLDKLREPAAFWGWVNGITANRCRRLLAAPHREWQIPEDEEGNSLLDRLENLDDQLVPEKALDDGETRRMILELVDELPPEQRMCVLFYYYDEMSVREIAQAMETSEGTVKSRLNYARKAIKKGVEEHERRGVKLYGVAPLLLLVYFLRQEAEACALDGTAAAATAAAAAQAGAAAEAGGAVSSGTASAAAGGGASGAASAASGVSVKVIAALVAGAVAVGGAAVGITTASSRERAADAPPAAVQTQTPVPVQTPQEEIPFALAYGFPLTEPQAYENLPVTLVLDNPALTALPSYSALTRPEITVSQPDEAGYVTYTVTYDISARSGVGSPEGASAYGISILAHEYNLYDYYTGRLYQPDGPETGDTGETSASGSTLVEHGGEEFELSYTKSWRSSLSPGAWEQSSQSGLAWEQYIDSAMSVTITMRAPADYDGVLLGINVTDPADPQRTVGEEWDLEADDPSHFRFVRLWETGE